ncbi:MAG: VCBS repeat-containing protein [Gemmatimonadetes bacterium]|nr:VCBS repeat-containing protein [Gemmatimonadota bacterium]MYE94469.1 VCBS repeat-containing protein [Gemmatimonadota bacterium]MYJ12414.1 VCBS repeat-containing protein [Gemmatimonadota bacterium]
MRTTSRPSLGFAALTSAALALATPPTAAAGQLSFHRVEAVVGNPTTAILAHDLNGDGRLDLVASGGQSVFVLTGRGDGRFDVTWSGGAGANPVDLAAADLDGDGLADLAVSNHETDYVTLLFGAAGGAFERRDHSRFRVDGSPHPHAVRLHDIDSDGHADLLVDDRSPESIRLFRGRGDGTFSGATSVDVGGDPYRGMSLADVTGDGLADLITPNPDHVAVLVAKGDGGFRPRATLSAAFGPFSVVAADLNGDGRHDVAAASGEGAGLLATWHGLAERSFRAVGRYEIARGPTKIAAADLNGDGSAEVLVASYAGGEVAVLVGGDTPLLQRIEIEGSPYGLATGDFDGDGRVDFAVANDAADYVSVFLTR